MLALITTAPEAGVDITYEFRHGNEVYYGRVTEQPGGQMVRFEEDAPWKDPRQRLSKSFPKIQVEYYLESSNSRAKRRRDGYEERGFVNVARLEGDEQWVPREEAQRAERAVAMVTALSLPEEGDPPPAPPREATAMPENNRGDSPLRYWPHAVLVLAGLALVGVVTRTLIVPG